ncbi:hypothetical protein JKG68_27220 [Microvirga aerilata]|uniref:Uncharacterized protein n=1 Tax=Microvirga aerilata TaxID=670292 RepID=A0A936ZAE1_9HYPH|nr:hypothetical protein [Microvirga aerilata]MBL0407613.1 hypothetical protein [Microvirga aerilata]
MLDAAHVAGPPSPVANHHMLSLSRQTCPGARLVWCDTPPLSDLTYLAVRPTFEFGDYTVGSTLTNAMECQLQIGEAARPSYAAAIYDCVVDALDDALTITRLHPHLMLWYNGQEVQAPFSNWRTLAVVLSEADEAWEVVAQVADGHLKITDPSVREAVAGSSLIGIALQRVAR